MKGAVPALARYLQERAPRLFHPPGNHTIRPAAQAIAQAGYEGLFVPKVTNPLVGKRTGWWKRRTRRLAYRRALRRADTILVLSPPGRKEVAATDGALEQRIRVVHNPYVNDQMVRSSAHRRPVSPPVILSVGRLSVQKDQATLLRAASRLQDREWRLRLCGTGPQEDALRVLADELGITERVEFAGFVADPVAEYLGATVMAMSSRWEGLPATVLEAIACGCPVIATASSPGLVNLLKEVGARAAMKVGDDAGLAAALEEALDGRLPVVPPEASLPYGFEAAIDEHAALFHKLLSARR
jgi:glycosyltransferase involved in cell wall biosynthesis